MRTSILGPTLCLVLDRSHHPASDRALTKVPARKVDTEEALAAARAQIAVVFFVAANV